MGGADVAETTYTPFRDQKDARPVRLIVRRVRPFDAAVQLAKLVGLDIKRVQVTGANGAPLLQLPPHPIDDFARKELDKRARMWVEVIDAEDAEVENEPG
jgi:hypothetical protein